MTYNLSIKISILIQLYELTLIYVFNNSRASTLQYTFGLSVCIL